MREAVAEAESRIASISARWPAATKVAGDIIAGLKAEARGVPPTVVSDSRVPVRNPEVRGPLGVYDYDHLDEALSGKGVNVATLPPIPTLASGDGDLMQYEALNLADGRRSIGEIRDVLTGRYQPVPADFLAAYFAQLAAAGVVTWK